MISLTSAKLGLKDLKSGAVKILGGRRFHSVVVLDTPSIGKTFLLNGGKL